jgi:hypothetical protein
MSLLFIFEIHSSAINLNGDDSASFLMSHSIILLEKLSHHSFELIMYSEF